MLALCDFLEDSDSVGDSAVLPAGDCGWIWFEVDQEPWPVICAQYRCAQNLPGWPLPRVNGTPVTCL